MEGKAAEPQLSALARRLYNTTDDIEQRLSFGSDAVFFCGQLGALYRERSQAWPALEAFLARLVAERPATLVYGDYDVDGSCSVFLLHRWLRSQNVPGNWFLPSRFSTGYGLEKGNLEKAIAHGYKALIALDCGTTSMEEIDLCRRAGMQVAVIDHHSPKAALPDALLFNPHTDPGLPMLCTAGLVFGALCALWAAGGSAEARYGDEIEAAGLATIADVAPLNPYGWAMAHHALKALPGTLNLGLAELQKVARLHGISRLTGRNIGFDIAPRMNAAGRMQHAKWIPELLLSRDHTTARELAQKIDRLNEDRKAVGKQVTEQAMRQALSFEGAAGLVLADSQWHPGVLGIAAARVAEQLGKPVMVLGAAPGGAAANGNPSGSRDSEAAGRALAEESGGAHNPAAEPGDELLSGSVRSALKLDLLPALHAAEGVLFSFGGHSAAAGVKVWRSRLPELRRIWDEALHAQIEALAKQTEYEPAPEQDHEYPEVLLGELTAAFEEDVWRLSPSGPDWPAPRFVLRGLSVSRVSYMGADKTHLNLLLTDGTAELRVAGFNMSHLFFRLSPGLPVRPLVEVDADNWNNKIGISLRLIELL